MAERANIAGPTGQHRFLCIQRCVYVLSNKNLSIGILSNSALSAQLAYFDNLQLSRDISNIFCLIGHYESKRCTLWIDKNDTSRIFQSLVPYRGLSKSASQGNTYYLIEQRVLSRSDLFSSDAPKNCAVETNGFVLESYLKVISRILFTIQSPYTVLILHFVSSKSQWERKNCFEITKTRPYYT